MVEIAQKQDVLLADVARTETPPGCGAFWWLGQHTFIVKAGGHVFYLDPWFAPWESRQTRTLLLPESPHRVDFALVSHGHEDHLCPESLRGIAQASPETLFICPRTEAQRMLTEAGIPESRLRPLNAGETLEHQGVRITAIKSKHETFDERPQLGFPYLGYVVEAGGRSITRATRSSTMGCSARCSAGRTSTRCSCPSTGGMPSATCAAVWATLPSRRRRNWRASCAPAWPFPPITICSLATRKTHLSSCASWRPNFPASAPGSARRASGSG